MLNHETARRRTFAIISHPDAGKTTLTEKLLLYGGAVALAGTVTARKNQRLTTSDWMELEQKRGISISSTVLQFDYKNFRINLLDTPGHKDFSEDTYRVLTAVDAAVLVIDAAKGIESQTRKLFEVCRRRNIPIFTFMNKLDRPSRDPLELLDELERVLGIHVCPMNWPLGAGPDFKGVWDRRSKLAYLYERTPRGAYKAPVQAGDLADAVIRDRLDPSVHATVCEEVEMLEELTAAFDREAFSTGKATPVFFGSALNNFGVQLLLDYFVENAPPPLGRCSGATVIQPDNDAFSGFIFKLQANMDPRHRDIVAFVRVVSGRFARDMTVWHSRTGQKIRLSNSSKVFGRDRETVDEAYPGDVIGLVGHSSFGIGDTLSEDPTVAFDEIPRFPPECFAFLHNPIPSNFKRFRTGLKQLLQEGVVRELKMGHANIRIPLLAAVGPLQFEIVQFRLETEYGAESRVEHTPWTRARWLVGDEPDDLQLPTRAARAADAAGRTVLLFVDEWSMRYFAEQNPKVQVTDVPQDVAP